MRSPHPRIRSALFTPGTEPAWLRKAVDSGADACIFDLEDAVARGQTAEARGIVGSAVHELRNRAQIWVRVNSAAGAEMKEDVPALPLHEVGALMLPKVGGPEDLRALRAAIADAGGPADLPLVPIVESAAGAMAAAAIAQERGVFCLAFGRFDMAADLGIDPQADSPAMQVARGQLLLASRAAWLPAPLDSPWMRVVDLEGLRRAAEVARREGFGGMLAIHPSHVQTINAVFRPTSEEIEWARSIVVAAERAAQNGRGAFVEQGSMVDEAIVRRARSILEEAER